MSDQPEQWWVDPSFDPLQDLHECKREIQRLTHIVNKLIQANNIHDQSIVDLANQNTSLVTLYRKSQREIVKLNLELDELIAKNQ